MVMEQQAQQQRRFKYGGVTFTVPSNWDDRRINDALQNYRNSPQFDAMIDKKTGAPSDVRLAVSAAKRREDQLATLQKYYPDAAVYGDDNFVYTDPEDGTLKLYDETKGGLFGSGFTFNDVWDVSREVVGAAGGIGGAAVAAPFGGVSAVGGAAGGEILAETAFDYLTQKFLGTVDTRTTAQTVGDLAVSGVAAAIGEGIGRYALPPMVNSVKRVLGGGTERSKAIHDALIARQITPTAGAVTQGKGAARIEGALEQAPTATTRMMEQVEKVVKETENAVSRLASRIGNARSQQETGVVVQKAVDNAVTKYHQKVHVLEESLKDKIGEDTLFSLDNVRALRDEWKLKIAQLPEYMEPKYKPAMQELDRLLTAAERYGGDVPYSRFREARTNFRIVSEDFQSDAQMRPLFSELYRTMTADLKDGVARVGLEVAEEFDKTMRFQATWKEANQKTFEKITRMEAPERAYRYLINERKDGGTMLAKLKEEFTDDEWGDISSTVLRKMGFKNFGNEMDVDFSIATFMTNWRSISKEAKDAFFGAHGAELRGNLDELAVLISDLEKSSRLRNFSNTAGAVRALDDLAALGMDISQLGLSAATNNTGGLVGSVTKLAGNVLGRLFMPNQIAKMITNPDFVKWLATPVRGTSEIGGKIGQLMMIAANNPDIREEIYQFIEALGPVESEAAQ
jgi:hypothetical protein